MATVWLMLVVVLVIAGLVFGVVTLLSGGDQGLAPAEPDERARPLPGDRSLREEDLRAVRFDLALRGYRMTQVDRVLRRTAYDLGYKDEMIAVLEAEVTALRDGRLDDADELRAAREQAASSDRLADREFGDTGEFGGDELDDNEFGDNEFGDGDLDDGEFRPAVSISEPAQDAAEPVDGAGRVAGDLLDGAEPGQGTKAASVATREGARRRRRPTTDATEPAHA